MVKATTIIKDKIVAEEEFDLNFKRQNSQKKLTDYQLKKGEEDVGIRAPEQ